MSNNEAAADSKGAAEEFLFKGLQKRFASQYEHIFQNDIAEKTVVVVPSLTLDVAMLRTIKGIAHYEERLLCLLMLLRMPNTHLVYITSVPIPDTIIDYYLYLLPGITGQHARRRLTLLSCHDASRISLTEKIVKRPRLIQRIKQAIKNPQLSHLVCFNVTELETKLALTLDIPIYGTHPDLLWIGTKSGGRKLFRSLGMLIPDGIEDLKNENDVIDALVQMLRKNPSLKKVVIKLNDGFSGEGNAIFSFKEIGDNPTNLREKISSLLKTELKIVAAQISYNDFMEKLKDLGAIVEEFIEGDIKTSPSVQCRINPVGGVEIISTHEQVMGGESGQVFIGAAFPALDEYNKDIAHLGKIISKKMNELGVLGRFGIDFLSVKNNEKWTHYAIEVNLRKGGTTHPFIMLQFLTGGIYNWQKGKYVTPQGTVRCYFSSDNVFHEKYKGLTPDDLVEIAIFNKLMYDGVLQKGVMFHMIGALSQYGKLGMVCIAETQEEAMAYYNKTLDVLNRECEVI